MNLFAYESRGVVGRKEHTSHLNGRQAISDGNKTEKLNRATVDNIFVFAVSWTEHTHSDSSKEQILIYFTFRLYALWSIQINTPLSITILLFIHIFINISFLCFSSFFVRAFSRPMFVVVEHNHLWCENRLLMHWSVYRSLFLSFPFPISLSISLLLVFDIKSNPISMDESNQTRAVCCFCKESVCNIFYYHFVLFQVADKSPLNLK